MKIRDAKRKERLAGVGRSGSACSEDCRKSRGVMNNSISSIAADRPELVVSRNRA